MQGYVQKIVQKMFEPPYPFENIEKKTTRISGVLLWVDRLSFPKWWRNSKFRPLFPSILRNSLKIYYETLRYSYFPLGHIGNDIFSRSASRFGGALGYKAPPPPNFVNPSIPLTQTDYPTVYASPPPARPSSNRTSPPRGNRTAGYRV